MAAPVKNAFERSSNRRATLQVAARIKNAFERSSERRAKELILAGLLVLNLAERPAVRALVGNIEAFLAFALAAPKRIASLAMPPVAAGRMTFRTSRHVCLL